MNFEMPTLSTLHTLLDPIDCRQEQQRHLSSVLPALSAALGVPIPTPVHPHPQQLAQSLHIPSCERVVVVFIDGLGFWNLALRIGHTPNMRAMLRQQSNDQPIWTTQPSTTSVAIPTFGTGTAPGFTGMFGYTQRNPRTGNKAQMITFTDDIAPREVQHQPTLFSQIAQQGIRVTSIGLPRFEHSALTEAALKGGAFIGSESPRMRLKHALAANNTPGLTYLYIRDLDKTAHKTGWDNDAWVAQLEKMDTVIGTLRRMLAPGTVLVITADHGVVNMVEQDQIDIADNPILQEGVELVAGEPRAPMLYTTPGQQDAVAQRWQEVLADRAVVVTQQEALNQGIFGAVQPHTLPWLADVFVLTQRQHTIVDSRTQREQERTLPAVHGSRTQMEMEIPLLIEML